MKKRLIAFLLVLIMVLGMLPVSALAADGSCKVAVQIDQGHYYTSAGDETGINRYECTLSVDDSSEHTFGYEFIWNSDAGGKSYDGGWQLCLTVDGTPAERPNAYVYSNNMAGAKAVIAKFSGEELKRDRNASCAARLVMQDYGEMDYRKTYTLNFDANGGKDAPAPQTIKSSTGKATFMITAMTPTRQNYVFQGWSKTQDGDAAYPPRELIEVTDTSTTLYAVWEKNDSPVPDNPGGTKPDVANAQVKICVQCIEGSATHQPKDYGILPGAYVDVLLQVDGTNYYSITLNRAKYIEKFGQDSGKTHTDTEPNESIEFKWQWKNGKWELISDIAPVIKVKCDTTTKPSKPALNEGSPVLVQCVQAGTHTDSGKDSAKKYFALGGYAYRYEEVKKEGSNVWKDEADNKWTYQLKLKRDEFVKAYNNLSLVTTHTDTNPGEETYVTWKHDGTSWKLVPAAGQTSAGIGAVINVKCTPVPTSDEPTLANTDLNLIVKCVTNNAAHSERSMPLKAGTFKMIGTVQDRGPLKFCTIEVETAQYVAEFDTDRADTHTAAKTIRVELYLKKNDSTAKWTNNKSATDNVIEVTCEPEAPTADELKKLEMAVQVKCVVDAAQQHTSAYGLLGEYDEDYFVGEPRKVGDDWLCDINYYPERYVAAFNTTFQNLKHVQNDEKIVPVTLIWVGGSWQIKTQGRVHVTEVYTVTYTDGVENEEVFADQVYSDLRKDSATPAFNGTPTRTGYTFAGWEPEVAATVTQTVTYVAKWTPVEPTHDDIFKALNGLVTVTCINRFWKDGNKNMDCGQGQYAAKAGIAGQEYTLEKGENAGTWVVTFPVTNFVKSFKQDPAHNLYTKDTLRWYIRWENNAWTSAPVEPGVDDLVKLTHAPTDWREVAKIATGGKSDCIHVSCVNGETGVCDYGITVPFVYSATDVVSVEPEDGVPGSYIATFKVDRYIDTCAKACNDKNFKDAPRTHKLLTQETVQWRLYATSEADEKIGNNVPNHVWEAEPVKAGKDDVCTIAHNWVVTFDPNGGTPVPLAQEVEYGHTATKPVEPTLKGYTFDGWYLDGEEEPFDFGTTITSDITLKAKWTQNTYTVTFDANGGEGTMDDQTFTYDEEKALTTNAFTRTGYTFTGWNTAADGTGEAFADKATVKNLTAEPNGAVTLYAQWEAKNDTPYKVKYYIEKLDGTYDYNDSYEGRGTTDTRIDATKVHNKSYENFTLDLNHPDTVQFGNIAGDGSLVLKLFYTRNTYDYTVRHIKQLPDGSYDEANAEVETLSGKFEALAAVTAKDYGSHYPTNNADTKQNIKIEEGLTIDVKYDLDEHTLTFETNGGSAINPVTVRHGNAVARPADPTKDKYTFIGWYADPEFTEEYDFATVLEADKTIYAKFELTSTPIGDIYVRYDVLHIKQLPDGTYDLANAEVEHLRALKDTTVTAVIKDYRATHHVNVNRTLSKLTGTAIQPYMGVDGKPVYTILSVYYDLDFHTLTFDTMGGSKIAPETVRHGLTVAKPKDPVNGGYIFDGWYTDKTFRHRYDFSTPLTEDITIYAKWFLIVLPGVTVKKNTPKLNTADHFAYVQGYPNGTVKPAGNITRAETAAILFRLMDDASRKTYYSTKSGFRDVASGSWYNTYVATLNNAGVITDSSNGYFRPNEAITRAELAAMLAKFSETTGAANYFNDVSAKYWAANAIAICAKLGWITGYPDGTFRPDKNVTRAELMAMINRATGRAPKSADAFLPGMKTWIDNTADKWYYLDVQEATNSHSYTVKGSETWTALTSDPNWSLYE